MADSNETILQALLEIKQDVGEIKATVTSTRTDLDKTITRLVVVEDQQKRVKWFSMGVSATVGAVLTVAWRVIEAMTGTGHH